MLQRIALFIAALAAAFVVAIGLAGAGFAPGGQAAVAPAVTAVASDQPTDAPQVDTVYVPAPVAPKTVVVHRNIPPSGEHENETEGSGD